MIDSGRAETSGLGSILSALELDRGPVSATANIRRVGLTERPDVIAARFYFERTERLFRLAEPDSGVMRDLRNTLNTIAARELDLPIYDPSGKDLSVSLSTFLEDLVDPHTEDDRTQDRVSDLWKCWQSLKHVTFIVMSSGILALTPAARPLIQLSIELQDFLFGRRDGMLPRARKIVGPSHRGHGSEQRHGVQMAGGQLTPFQAFVATLAASNSKIDNGDAAIWLEACSDSLEAAILYLTQQGFPPFPLGPLKKLAGAIRGELSGVANSLFNEDYGSRHGPELSPSKPPQLHRLYFNVLLIHVLKEFRSVRHAAKLRMNWLDDQLSILKLRNQDGEVITVDAIRKMDRRQNDDSEPNSGFFLYRQAVAAACREFLQEVQQPIIAPAAPPQLRVQTLLQTVLLYEPRHLPIEAGKRRARNGR